MHFFSASFISQLRPFIFGALLALNLSSYGALPELKIGDVLLISMPCYECRLIEEETDGPFSHSSIIIDKKNGQYIVAQSLGDTHTLPLKKWLTLSRPNGPLAIMRSWEGQSWDSDLVLKMRQYYQNKLHGLAFDPYFLWNNTDHQGLELLYCSEMITKLLNHILKNPIEVRPMDFSLHGEAWSRFLPLGIPQGLPGTNPNTFFHSKRFQQIFYGQI